MTIEQMWKEAIKGPVKFNTPQVEPLKRCFYAGIYSILKELMNSHPESSEFFQVIQSCTEECKKYLCLK